MRHLYLDAGPASGRSFSAPAQPRRAQAKCQSQNNAISGIPITQSVSLSSKAPFSDKHCPLSACTIMRLINCCAQPLRLEEFGDDDRPAFAILSHTWEAGEVTYQDFANTQLRTTKNGWKKLEESCRMSTESGFDYLWMDTCCIDKQNTAELAESINSMFQWYSEADLCLAYISDYSALSGSQMLARSRWFERGWTLQELIAPKFVSFYDREWRLFGTRSSMLVDLSAITNIGAEVLSPAEGVDLRDLLDDIPAARRMSWAAKRKTTKKEDIAYCLLGIFGVNMPMLYGEGMAAFIRLQEEIINDSNDLTIFAWTSPDRNPNGYRGILASSPAEFVWANDLEPINDAKFNPEYTMSNKGLRIQTLLYPTNTDQVIMPLRCRYKSDPSKEVGVVLKHQGASLYARAQPDLLGQITGSITTPAGGSVIFISKRVKNSAGRTLQAVHRNAFHINFDFRPQKAVQLIHTSPSQLWDAENGMFITSGLRHFTAFHHFLLNGPQPGQFVFACGLSEQHGPWVHVEDDLGAMYHAASVNNLQRVAELGNGMGLRDGKHDLMTRAMQSSVWKFRFGTAKLTCMRKDVRGEPGIVVRLKVERNNPMITHF